MVVALKIRESYLYELRRLNLPMLTISQGSISTTYALRDPKICTTLNKEQDANLH